MKKLLRSFVAGAGSILSIYPQLKAASLERGIVEAIGGDFACVGGDITRAIDSKAGSVAAPKGDSPNGEAKEDQLELAIQA